ncbi:MAG TPA: winged helix-turn-helix domain-containing protein [Vicinamibacterales bacterium]|nr:winged helix-turn-helix domain-containing protein [Vicinamibacterales bacterium]
MRPARLILERDGATVRVKPKTMDVLISLVDCAGEVLTREQLLEKVWQNAYVTDDVITQAIGELRRALHDDVRRPVFIETIPRRGYRLIHPVRLLTADWPDAPSDAPVIPGAVRSRMRMAVLAGTASLAIAAGSAWLAFELASGAPWLRDSRQAPAVDGRPTHDTEAYELYLKARQRFRSYSNDSMEMAEVLSLAGRAVERDPDFAEAHALIAEIQISRGFWNTGPHDDILVEARRAASTALAIDPNLGYPHAVLGLATAVLDWQWETGYRQAIHATELDPRDIRSLSLRSVLSLTRGKTAEAVQLATQAYQLAPINPHVLGNLSWVLYQSRQYDEAAEFMVKTLEADPEANFARNFLPRALAYAGRHAEALAAAERASRTGRSESAHVETVGLILVAAGRAAEARSLIAQAPPGAYRSLRARLGDETALLDWLDELIEQRATSYVMWLRTGDTWDPVRRHPRFQQALERVGLH